MLHLSGLMENRGLIWASDRVAWRLAQLKRRAARAGVFNYRAVAWDGGPRLPTKTKFDGVLVDAPCSGIGTWHRNPHARGTATGGGGGGGARGGGGSRPAHPPPRGGGPAREEDVKELSDVQQRILSHAAGHR